MGDKPPVAQERVLGGLGRYHLGEPLGGGPTGEVFRAKVYGVAGYERQYALKRFHAVLVADPSTGEIIAAAARSYATISHPHVARLHEYGVAQGQSFVAVELVNGLDAARLLSTHAHSGDPLPQGALLAMLVQIARGVGYVHARGIAHLGICPTNVLIGSDGEPKVTDIGLLRARLGVRPAQDPSMLARLPYLAPEQLELAAGTAATDVFQLATLSVEVLSGERAFGGRSADEIAEAIADAHPEAGALVGPIWDALEPAFAREPSGRYANASAFADALEAAGRKLGLTGGRSELAAVVKRAQARNADVSAGNVSGALSFPLPAPPATSPGVSLASLAAAAAADKSSRPSPRTTLASLSVPPPTRPVPPPLPEDRDVARGSAPAAPVPPAAMSGPLPGTRTLTGAAPPPPGRRASTPASPAPGPPPLVVPAPAQRASKARTRAKRVSLPPRRLTDLPPPPIDLPPPPPLRPRRTRWPILVLILAALGAGGYLAFDQLVAGPSELALADAAVKSNPVPTAATPTPTPTATATEPPVAAPPDAASPGTVLAVPDAPSALVAVAAAPVKATAPPDAPPAPEATPATPRPTSAAHGPAPEGKLIIASSPGGAEVFLDGAEKGKTPLELPASGDHHKLALFLPGHRLARLDIEGKGKTEVDLEPAEKFRGPAGIKVRCTKRRVYVLVDDRDTGLMCPTERIAVPRGEHTVVTYDPQSEESSTQTIKVMETHASARVTAP